MKSKRHFYQWFLSSILVVSMLGSTFLTAYGRPGLSTSTVASKPTENSPLGPLPFNSALTTQLLSSNDLLPGDFSPLAGVDLFTPEGQPNGILMDVGAFRHQSDHAPLALANPISISRIQSSYEAGETAVITFTITNNMPPTLAPDIPEAATITETAEILAGIDISRDSNTIRNVAVVDTMTAGVFIASSLPPDRQVETLVWNFGDIPPQTSRSFSTTFQLPVTATTFVELDTGAEAYGSLKGRMVQAKAPPAMTVPTGLEQWLIRTPDADIYDEHMLAKAAEFGQDTEALFAYVQSFGFESYIGSLRGTRGTLWSQAGNAIDQASLLIAMLRAGGIPARYRHGTLDVAQAQELILSMFPTPTQLVGHIPPGTEVSDPANDPALIAEAQDHWWVEAFLPGQGWTDLDPVFADAQIGESFADTLAADGTDQTAELPDSLRHKLNLTLNVEQYSGFPIGGVALRGSTPLTETFNVVELVGRPINLGFWVDSEGQGGLLFSNVIHTYTPYFRIGLSNTFLVGDSFQDLITTYPLGTTFTTGVWLIVEQESPDGTVDTYERIIKDLIGPEARQGGGQIEIPVRDNAPLLNEADVAQLQVVPQSFVPPTEVERLQGALLSLAPYIASGFNELNHTDFDDVAEQFDYFVNHLETLETGQMLLLETLGALFQVNSTATQRPLGGEVLLVKSYPSVPKLVLMSQTSITNTMTTTFELLNIHERALAYPAQAADAVVTANFARSVGDKAIEYEIMRRLLGDNLSSPFAIMSEAADAGVPMLIITDQNLEILGEAPIPEEVKAQITTATRQDLVVFVPSGLSSISNKTSTAWIEIDVSGHASFVSDNGMKASVALLTISLIGKVARKIAARAAGFFTRGFLITMIYFAASAIGLVIVSDFTKGSLLEAAGIAAAKASIDCAFYDSLGKLACIRGVLFAEGILLNVILTGGLYTRADPSLPSIWFAPDIRSGNSRKRNTVFGIINRTETMTASSIIGSFESSHISVIDEVNLIWSDSISHNFQLDTLIVANVQLINEGTFVAQGPISVDSTIPATLKGMPIMITLNGRGSQSYFAPATSGLLGSSQWTNYTAELTSTQPYSITLTDATVILDDSEIFTGTLTAVVNGEAHITGRGDSPLPQFSPSVTIEADDAQLNLGPLSGTIVVGGQVFSATNGLAVGGYTGPVTISESSSTADLVEFNGAADFFTLNLQPAVSTLDPTQNIIIAPVIEANFDDSYTMTVDAPPGWDVSLDVAGQVTAVPPSGAEPGDYFLLVSAQSSRYPDLFVSAVHSATITAHEGLAFTVTVDPLISVPMGQILDPAASVPGPLGHIVNGRTEVPDAAYTINLTNTSTTAHLFDITVSGLPDGWAILSNAGQADSTTLLLPAGGVGQLGLYISPTVTTLMVSGTSFDVDVTATAQDNPSLTQTDSVTFIMPQLAFPYLHVASDVVYVTPGSPATFDLSLTNVGNIAGSFPVSLTLFSSPFNTAPLSPTRITIPETFVTPLLAPGATITRQVVLTTTGTTVGDILFGSAETAAGEFRPTVFFAAVIAGPNSTPIFEAGDEVAACTDNVAFSSGFHALATALNELELTCSGGACDLAARDRAVGAVRLISEQSAGFSSLVTTSPLDNAANNLAAESDDTDIQTALEDLSAAIPPLATEICQIGDHLPRIRWQPGFDAALVSEPATYTLEIENQGRLTTTYAITLQLPTGQSTFEATLGPGQVIHSDQAANPGVVGLHELSATATATGPEVILDGITASATARLNVVNQLLQVTAVRAAPPFVETGISTTTLHIDVSNNANLVQETTAGVSILAPDGISYTAEVSLTILAGAPRTYDLGMVDTSGWVEGLYTVTVELSNEFHAPVAGGSGFGYLFVGQALGASQAIQPVMVAPGDMTVTTVITTEILPETILPSDDSIASLPFPGSNLAFDSTIPGDSNPPMEPAIPGSSFAAQEPDLKLFSTLMLSYPASSNSLTPAIQITPTITQTGIVRLEENHPAILYNGLSFPNLPATWQIDELRPHVSGGESIVSQTSGDVASLTFEGRWVSVGFGTEIGAGQVELFIDGESQETISLNTDGRDVVSRQYGGLITGTHTISITVVGTARVALDYIDIWDGTLMPDELIDANLAETTGRIFYSGRLETESNNNALGEEYIKSTSATGDANVWYAFTGDSFTFLALTGGNEGMADVFVDGVRIETVDLSYPFSSQSRTFRYQGLEDGPHVVRIKNRMDFGVDAFSSDFDVNTPEQPHVEWHDNTPAGSGSLGGLPNGILTTVAVGDVTGDGDIELVVTGDDGSFIDNQGREVFTTTLYLYQGNGLPLSGESPIIWRKEFTAAVNHTGELLGSPAIADLDGQPGAEIVVAGEIGIFAFHADGSSYWFTNTLTADTFLGTPAIGNLDDDPEPEIVVNLADSLAVIEADGTLSLQEPFPGAMPPILADLTGDGLLDILVTDQNQTVRLYEYNFGAPEIVWSTVLSSSLEGMRGTPAVADIDGQLPGGDDGPEIAITSNGLVTVLDADGTVVWSTALDQGEGGGVSIADVDGDSEVEIVTSIRHEFSTGSFGRIYALNADGTVLWLVDAEDNTSANAVSVLDLEGDGVWEIVWNGFEKGFTIFNGADGAEVFNEPLAASVTGIDYPIISDVDLDGYAEVVVPALDGVFVFGLDGLWGPARPLWNQHTYHITNINDDLSIPPGESNSWDIHNTYHTQTPLRSPMPRHEVTISHTVGISGVTVLSDSFSIQPDVSAPPLYRWNYEQTWEQPVMTRTFQSLVGDLKPGETRIIAQGTEIIYTLPSGQNRVELPPLYVTVPHIGMLSPVTRQTVPGSSAVYTLTLTNPATLSDIYTLEVVGLPSEWASIPQTMTLPALGQLSLPVSISVPMTAEPETLPFLISITNNAGGRDQAVASLTVVDSLNISITPKEQTAEPGTAVTYTLTLTNAEPASRTYELSAAGLPSVNLPATVTVDAGNTHSITFTAAATNERVHPFIISAEAMAGSSRASDTAVLSIAGNRNIGLKVNPASNIAGAGSTVIFTVTITNSGTLADEYTLSATLPDGWSYRLSENDNPVDTITLSPHLFNSADLQLAITPDAGAGPGSVEFSVTAQSESDSDITAIVTGTVEVLPLGVQVEVSPEQLTLNPANTGNWQIQVTNTGSVADTFVLTATGLVGLSGTFSPDVVTLAPGQSTTVQLTADELDFALAASYEFEVLVQSTSDGRIRDWDRATISFTEWEAVEVTWQPGSQVITDSLLATPALVVTNTGNRNTLFEFNLQLPGLNGRLPLDEITLQPHMAITLPVQLQASASGTYVVTATATSLGGQVDAAAVTTLTMTANSLPQISSMPVLTYHLPTTATSAIVLTTTVRDFQMSHPDFELAITDHITGLVSSTLGIDGNPIFIGVPGQGAISGSDSFNQWYNDDPGVNLGTIVTLTLEENATSSNVFSYDASETSALGFFPIDEELFGNEGNIHNYHFTLELHTSFTYQGGERFTFAGDDDIWVFIDERLVVDLGGVHGIVTGTVDLDSLGLTVGDVYSFDFFFAERHTTESNFKLETSIELEPSSQYAYQVTAEDPDGDLLTYRFLDAPDGMTIDPDSGLITWNPTLAQAGPHTVVLEVSDGRGGVTVQNFLLLVLIEDND